MAIGTDLETVVERQREQIAWLMEANAVLAKTLNNYLKALEDAGCEQWSIQPIKELLERRTAKPKAAPIPSDGHPPV